MIENHAVIGLGFGDEGKGVVTNYLCHNSAKPVAVQRFSGGHQAGHTVVWNGLRHVFSNFGSGTLVHKPTIWGPYCTIDPVGIMREHKVLQAKGFHPFLSIHPNCPVTTPYDKIGNQRNVDTLRHGSCGVGYGATIARQEAHYSLVAADLRYPSVLRTKLGLIRDYYNLNRDEEYESIFFKGVEEILTHFNIGTHPHVADEKIVYEGSQGLLLDKDIGFFPHVTRGNTGTANLRKLGVNPELWLVTRCYQTRHGNGPMTNTELPHTIQRDPNETNMTDQYQGKFRISVLDADLLRYAIERDPGIKKFNLCITCIEHVKGEHQFTVNGNVRKFLNVHDFAKTLGVILKADNILTFRNHTEVENVDHAIQAKYKR